MQLGFGIAPPVVQLVCLFVELLGLTPLEVELIPDDFVDAAAVWVFFTFPGALALPFAGAEEGAGCAAGAGAVAASSAFVCWPGAVSRPGAVAWPGGASGGAASAVPVDASATANAAHAAPCRRIECICRLLLESLDRSSVEGTCEFKTPKGVFWIRNAGLFRGA
jgi:hypothetical protein